MEREKEQWNSNTKEAIDTKVRYEKNAWLEKLKLRSDLPGAVHI